MKERFTFSEDTLDRETIATLTTLSNGFLSIRGDPEFVESAQGTFVAGVYSFTPIFYRELVNLPRAHSLYAEIEGIPFVPDGVKYTLDVRRGLLEIESTLSSPHGRLEYKSTRFVHREHKGLVGLKATFRSIDASGRLYIDAPIELEFSNPSVPPEVSVRLYRILSKSVADHPMVTVETADGKYKLRMASKLKPLFVGNIKSYSTNRKIGQLVSLDVHPGLTFSVERFAVVGNCEEDVNSQIGKIYKYSFEELLDQHVARWEEEWIDLGIQLEGDEELANALIFNTFHLLQIYNEQSDIFIVPAKGLHGYGYRGHVFWDTEIYAFPFYLLFKPDAAKKILTYRCRLLDAAIENARRNGYWGAQYPWESADDGFEATPREVPLDLTGERKVRIYTGDLEHHITADIAYAVDLYYRFTGDWDFLEECGLPMLINTARFWASRVEWDSSKEKYVIRNVIGPDEYHVGVNNNFYTNIMAKYNLELAASYSRSLMSDHRFSKVLGRLNVRREEIEEWEDISSNIYLNCDSQGLCEQFEGYFNLKDYRIAPETIGEKNLPAHVLQSVQDYQLIKQADVLAAIFLLRERFSKEVVEKNYDYYLHRTTHASSLSLPMYAAVALYLGRLEEGIRMLKTAALADIADIYKNSKDGFHVGSAGGVWMALLFGLLKMQEGEQLTYSKPGGVPLRLSFNVKYRGRSYKIET